ncbi:MAG: S1 family peptidase [Chloroflexota bacterium]|nr:S1 family peptidase [Chloroflexota bacterium]
MIGRQFRSIALLASMVLISALVIGLAPISAATHAGSTKQPSLLPMSDPVTVPSEAVRFRTEFGLDADPRWIRAAEALTNADTTHGISLTADEANLMKRRGEIRSSLLGALRLGQAQPDNFGGMWTTYPPGGTLSNAMTVNFGVKGSPTLAAALEKLVPDGAAIVVHASRYSEAELDALNLEVAKDQSFFAAIGTEFQSVDTVVPDNVDEIAVSPLTSEVEKAILDRYGSEVRVVAGGGVDGDACTRQNCGPPSGWKGGIEMTLSTNASAHCTTGPVMKKPSGSSYIYAVATAGHCTAGNWRQGATTGGTSIGTSTSANVWFTTQTSTDFQIIPITAANASKWIIDGSAACSGCTQHAIYGQQDWNSDASGDEVCNEGYYSGHRCGQLVSTNYTFNWTAQNKIFYSFRRATYVRNPGDSGGPVWATATGYIAGTHTHYVVLSGVVYPVYPHIYSSWVYSGGYDVCYPYC